MNEELIRQCRIITGWSIEKIHKSFPDLNCNYWDALNFFKYAGRLPTEIEQRTLNEFGFDALRELWRNNLTNKQ